MKSATSNPKCVRNRESRSLRFESLEHRQLFAGQIYVQPAVSVSSQEQLTIEIVNRARGNPTAEAQRQGIDLNIGVPVGETISATPKQPLAPNASLQVASEWHSQDMIDRDYFNHDADDPAPHGKSAFDRAGNAGFNRFIGENIQYTSFSGNASDVPATIRSAHTSLFTSLNGHRQIMMTDEYTQVGMGVVLGDYTSKPEDGGLTLPVVMTTQLYGSSSIGPNTALSDQFITGVVYTDAVVNDDFYTVDEGISGNTVEARSSNGDVYRTTTSQSGGYALRVPPGNYAVYSTSASAQYFLGNATVANQNIKLDLPTDLIPPAIVYDTDANRDGILSYLDALAIINFVNLEMNSPNTNLPREFPLAYDINKNQTIDPFDVLIVINEINRGLNNAQGEGESVATDSGLGLCIQELIDTDQTRLRSVSDRVRHPAVVARAR